MTPTRADDVRSPGAAAAEEDSPALRTLRDLMSSYAVRPVRSIAVVGNAPLEPSVQRASAIDACDLVIRCNSFVVDRPADAPRMGRRADVAVVNRLTRVSPAVFDGYRDRLFLLVEPGRLHRPGSDAGQVRRWPSDLGVVTVPNREVVLPLSAALGLDSRRDGVWATTGTISAWLAALLFADASLLLTGFSMLDDPNQSSWRHQWGDACPVAPVHQLEPEARLLASWVESGRATFLR